MNVVDDLLRAGSLIGLVLLVGVATYWVYLWPEGRWRRAVTVLAWTGWSVVAGTTLALLGLDLARAPHGLMGVVATAEGTSLILRLALLCLAWAWLYEVNRTYGGSTYRGMSPAKSFAGGLVLALLPLTFVAIGHAADGSWPVVRAVLLSLRVDALTLWLGGLVAVAVAAFVLPRNDRSEIRAAVPRFTVIASSCAAAVVLTVALHAVVAADGIAALLHSRHGLVAAAKVAAVAGLLWLGNRTLHRAGVERATTDPAGGDRTAAPIRPMSLSLLASRRDLVVLLTIVLLAAALLAAPA